MLGKAEAGRSALPVVHEHRTRYAAGMRSGRRTCLALRFRRLARSIMLVLGVLSVPGLGTATMQPPHCAQHDGATGEQATHAGGMHQMPDASFSASWQSGNQHACPHCPPTECAQAAPCATFPTAMIVEGSGTVIPLTVDSDKLPKFPVQAGSRSYEPPTPPPQLIS